MSELKLSADSGGGSVSFKGPATTTSNAAVQLTLPVDDGSADQYLKTNGSGTLSWATVSSDPTTTSGTNNFTVADGDLVIGTSGHGISFAATSDGGTGTPVELLDDYEEGIWAPSPDIGTCTVGHASYTKIGDVVTCWFQVSAFSNTSASNGASISLPFAAQNSKNGSTGFNTTCGAVQGKNIHSDAQSLTPVVSVNASGSIGNFSITSDTDTWDKVRHQDLESNHVLQGFVTYKVA